MKENKGDTILNSIIFLLFGFLLGTALSDIRVTISDISSAFIAIAAVYGVLKWRIQHDYQIEKSDQREIIKLIKRCFFYCAEFNVSQKLLSQNLTNYINNKNDKDATERNKWIVKKLLERIDEQKSKLSETLCSIESEAATNLIVKNDDQLNFHIHCTLHRAEDCLISANATASVFQSFEELEHDENANFIEMEKQANLEYHNFLLAIGKVEQILGIANTSETKSLSYKAIQEFDKKNL